MTKLGKMLRKIGDSKVLNKAIDAVYHADLDTIEKRWYRSL